jgi:hypothetical protein
MAEAGGLLTARSPDQITSDPPEAGELRFRHREARIHIRVAYCREYQQRQDGTADAERYRIHGANEMDCMSRDARTWRTSQEQGYAAGR